MRKHFYCLEISGDKNDAFNNAHVFNVIANLNETVVDFFFFELQLWQESKVIFHVRSRFSLARSLRGAPLKAMSKERTK